MPPIITDDKVLKLPYRGAPQTVSLLQRSALEAQNHYAVRQLAEHYCRRLHSKDYLSEYLAVYYGLMATCRYMRDPRTVELVRAPYVVAEEILRGGRPNLDCDDMSNALAALVLSMGGSARYVTVAFRNLFFRGQRQYSHIFMQAQDPRTGTWIVLDPVAAENTPKMLRTIVAAKTWPIA